MVEIRITDGGETKRLAARLRAAADGGLSRELATGLDRSTQRLDMAVRDSALEHLPRRGGLNELVASSRIATEKITPLRLRIVAKGVSQLGLINRGFVNHPTYGRRPWRFQEIPKAAGWFTRPIRKNAGRTRRELERAMARTSRRITGR